MAEDNILRGEVAARAQRCSSFVVDDANSMDTHSKRILPDCSPPGVKEWRRARAAQGWYRMCPQQANLPGELPGPFEPIERDLGPVIGTVWSRYESSRDAL